MRFHTPFPRHAYKAVHHFSEENAIGKNPRTAYQGIRVMLHAMYILYSSLLISLPEDLVAGLVEAMTAAIVVGLMAFVVRFAQTPLLLGITMLVLLVIGAIFWRHSWYLSTIRQMHIKDSVKAVVGLQTGAAANRVSPSSKKVLADMKKQAEESTKRLKAKALAAAAFQPQKNRPVSPP